MIRSDTVAAELAQELNMQIPVGVEDKVAREVRAAAEYADWIKMIIPDEAAPEVVAGHVVLWSRGEVMSEIGLMVLPEFQGRGHGKRAVRKVLQLARDDGRWGLVHAFPATSLGFRFTGEQDVTFADRVLRSVSVRGRGV